MVISIKIYFFILITYLKLIICETNVYRIPFGLYNIKGKNFSHDIANSIFYNLIYVNLSIGTPSQNVPFGLSINSQTFTVYNKNFNKSKSSTFEEKSNFTNNDDEDEFVSAGINSLDVLTINNTKQKINFILSTSLANLNYPFGLIGLAIPKNVEQEIYPFFNSLKEGKVITSFTWSLKYFNNISLLDTLYGNGENNKIIGEFIFGNEPHYYEEDKRRYNKSQLIKVNPISTYDLSWMVNFNGIYLLFHENKNNNYTKQRINVKLNGRTKLIPDAGYNIISKEFKYILDRNFFSKYFKEGICWSKGLNDTFYGYIECNDSFEVSLFPDICFEHAEFETTFNLTYKDLFVYDKYNNKYIFLMLSQKFDSGWILGSAFFRKYQFIFNQDSKTIGYYKSFNSFSDEQINNDNTDNKDEIIKYIILGIIFIISSILLIFIGMCIQNKYFSKKKVKANEMDSYGYEDVDKEKNLCEDNSKKNFITNSINEDF